MCSFLLIVYAVSDRRKSSYQRLYFRNLNHPMVRPSVTSRRQEVRNDSAQSRTDMAGREEDRRYSRDPLPLLKCELIHCTLRSHIFDGVTVTKETAAFQLCDIHDPMLKEMIEDEEELREVCNVCFFSFVRSLELNITL